MTAPLPQRIQIADAPKTGDGIAPDLVTLIERVERMRKHLRVEREYIRLILVGGWFILFGTILTPDFPWRLMFLLALMVSPFLFAWYSMPLGRLSTAFRNEVLPFLLRDFGKWNYSHAGTHFSKSQFRATRLVGGRDVVGVSSIMTGERYGVPLQMAILSVWPETKFKIYRGHKALFEGWVANIRLPDAPQGQWIILPKDQELDASLRGIWKGSSLTPTHNLFLPPDAQDQADTAGKTGVPEEISKRILHCMRTYPQSRYAMAEGILWVMIPTKDLFFRDIPSFQVALNNPAPYEEARENLASMFSTVDGIVWPQNL